MAAAAPVDVPVAEEDAGPKQKLLGAKSVVALVVSMVAAYTRPHVCTQSEVRDVQMDSCAVSVTELEPGMLTSYHCSWGHPSAVVTAAGAGRLAPVDRELPPSTSVVSYVPFRRMVSMVAVPGAVFVMTRLSVVVAQEGVSAAAVAEAESVSGFKGVGSRTATAGSEPVNFTCAPEAM